MYEAAVQTWIFHDRIRREIEWTPVCPAKWGPIRSGSNIRSSRASVLPVIAAPEASESRTGSAKSSGTVDRGGRPAKATKPADAGGGAPWGGGQRSCEAAGLPRPARGLGRTGGRARSDGPPTATAAAAQPQAAGAGLPAAASPGAREHGGESFVARQQHFRQRLCFVGRAQCAARDRSLGEIARHIAPSQDAPI